MSEQKSKNKFSLRNLKIEEISGVDRGANPGAHVLFFKRNEKEPSDMDLKELTKKFEDLEKAQKDDRATIEKLQAEKDTLAALAKMSDAEKTFYKDLSEAKQAEFIKADAETRKAQMDDAEAALKKKKADDDSKTDVEKALAPVNKALEEANAKIQKLEDEKALSAFEKEFDQELPNFGGSADEKQELLKSLKAMPEEARKSVMSNLKKADDIKGEYFIEKGTAHRGPDDPVSKLDALAKKRAAEKSEDYSVAYAKVLETEEGQKLYAATGKN